MHQDDKARPKGKPNDIAQRGTMFASGGLSLEDFRQNQWLQHLEAMTPSPDRPPHDTEPSHLEHQARKTFRHHLRRERSRSAIRECQTVLDLNGRRNGPRDGRNKPTGDPFPCDGAHLFGCVRPKAKRLPQRSSSKRQATALQRLIERIVDEGLARVFLEHLSIAMKERAPHDPSLVRLFALLVSEAGFDDNKLSRRDNVHDDDDVLSVCDSKRTAELLTEFGHPSTARDVENTKKRLNRCLLDVGDRMFRRMLPAQGRQAQVCRGSQRKSDRHGR